MRRILLAFAAAALCAGCSTIYVTSEGGHTTVDIENTCWKVLGFLPIGSGDPETPNEDLCVWFRNTATLENNMKLLDYAVEKRHARAVRDVTTRAYGTWYMMLLKRSAIQTSAELITE